MKNAPIHILLADDDADDRMIFRDAFEELKMKTYVQTVNDGVELMNYLNTDDAKLPHVLFLDLNMPLKNGLQCLEEIRKSKKLRELSVAIYSTSSSEANIEETFIKGANIYIKKPTEFATLKKVLSEVMAINWQYQTSGLNKETFMLSI